MVLEVQGAEKHLHDFVTDIYNELNPAGLLVILVIPFVHPLSFFSLSLLENLVDPCISF